MNTLKKYLGIVWMLLAPSLVGFMVWQAIEKIAKASAATKSNDMLQWGIILFIFVPICIGLFIFGLYSFKGYYNKIADNSADLD